VPTVLTVLRVDVDADHAGPARALLEAADGVTGEPEVVTTPATGTISMITGFHLAGDAIAAAIALAATAKGGPWPRVTLSTGEVDARDVPLRGPARDRADALAWREGDSPVRLTASTAVMVNHALPSGAELVDLGAVGTGPAADERAYELRLASDEAAPGGRGAAGARALGGTITTPSGGRVAASIGGATDDDAGASNVGWAHRAASHVLVGRHGPLARLEGAWTAALGGDHRVVVLTGDPGIGKTTLAAELALRVNAAGATVLYGRWDEEGVAPFQAVREALGSYAAACPRGLLRRDIALHADELARLLPDLGARIGGVRPPSVCGCSMPCAVGSAPSPRGGPSSSCSTTCSGPSGRRCCSCATCSTPRPRAKCSRS
jgi:hypothetical protein